MADKKRAEQTNAGGSKDIAEMLRMLRDSVGKPVEEKPGEGLDAELDGKLREKLDSHAAMTQKLEETKPAAEPLNEESGEPLDVDEISEEDAPWYSDEEETDGEETAEETVEEEIPEEEVPEEEIPEEDDPWYSDEEETDGEETAEETVGEETAEEEVPEEEIPEEDDPWYSDEEESDEEETAEETVGEETVEEEVPEEEVLDEEIPEEEIPEDEPDEEAALDSTDLSLLAALGYSSASTEDGEEEFVHEDKKAQETDGDSGNIAYDYDGGEYVLEEQSDDILAGYKNEKKSVIKRMAITGGATLLLLLYEVLFFSGVTMPWIFNQYDTPVSHIMISLQLLLIIFAASARSMCKGIADLFTGRATPYSLSAMMMAANAVYTVAIAIMAPEGYMLFNTVPAVGALMAVVYEYILLCCEERTFEVVSDPEGDRSFAFEDDDCSGEVLGAPVRALRAFRTEFNKNYFTRTRKRLEDHKYLGVLICAVFALSLISFAVSAIVTSNIGESLKLWVLIIDFSVPLGTLGTFCLPWLMASKKMLRDRSALIGQSVVDEYSGVGFVTFDEEELFPSMKASHIDFKPSGSMPISEILRKTGLMFSSIGGPIRRLVELDDCTDGSAVIRGVFDNGISGTVEDSEMLVGSAAFLELHGVDVSASRDARDQNKDNHVLYVAIDGRLAARYYIKYRPDRDFVRMVNILGAAGVAVGVRTRNPGISSEIIAARCPEMRYPVYTIKSRSLERGDITSSRETTESGLFAKGKSVFLADPLIAAKELKKIYSADRIIRAVSAAIGAAAVIVISAFGFIREFNSVQASLYQLAWLLPTVATSMIKFLRRKQ